MKKTVGVLSGLVVAVAAVCTAGAWYTGKQLPEVLGEAMAQANIQLKQSSGLNGTVSVELASLESHLFSSTARYRVKVKDMVVGDRLESFELGFVDRIEHGPLPLSRLKAFKLMPVMATSNYALEKDAFTAEWFAASGEVAPVHGQNSLGYDGSSDGTLIMPPMKVSEAGGSTVAFSGLAITASGNRNGERITFTGAAPSLNLDLVDPQIGPLKIDLQNLSVVGDLNKTAYGFYVGSGSMLLDQVSAAVGEQQKVLLLKHIEHRSESRADGDNFSGNLVYKVGDINFDGKPVGSTAMVWNLKNIDMPAMQALIAWYQSRLPEFQAAAAQGQAVPSLPMSEAEKAQVNASVQQLLAARPQIALQDFSFKTVNGESHFNLSVDLAQPSSLELPPAELYRQLITQVQGKLQLSKPMIGDLASLQACLQGQSEAQIQAQQVSQTGEMVGMLAQQSQLATVQGNDILSSLHYADGMVDFNGQKMTVEQFANLIMANLGALQPQG
ncbi:YdgA family protein [Pseudomonas sp. GD03860]|uniref:YdgA family protein n=1 Tax=Pseudomonas sp. GD03860 TaxID=2975389 RepID=UPI002448F022|nr:YdgA family protein [Pseudomonas sp. GD03860]MDH0635357.1 YdgA family protein [Pseudomonas sp. GD03860]